MNYIDAVSSSAGVVDFDKTHCCYGRGKSKLINKKIHLEFHDEYEHYTTNSIKNINDDDLVEYIIENILMEPPSLSSSISEHNSYRNLKALYNTYYSLNCNCNNNDNIAAIAIDFMNKCNNFDYCIHGGNYIPSSSLSSDKTLLLQQEHDITNKEPQQQEIELILNEHRRISDLIYECSDKCSCSTLCYNRLIQYGPRNNLIIIDVSHLNKQQHGLSSSVSIPKGAFVCEYVGEIITKDEAQKRHEQNTIHNLMNYVICLNEYPMEKCMTKNCGHVADGNCCECIKKKQQKQQQIRDDATNNDCNKTAADNPFSDYNYDDGIENSSSSCVNSNNFGKHLQTFIDPSRKGNIGRYLNHSCDPNCEIFSIRIDGPIPHLGR